jgi:isopenicillin N synthase-like dioxygenase
MLPILDLTQGRDTLVHQTREAFEQTGFAIVTRHGVPPKVMGEMWDISRAFFGIPAPYKAEVTMKPDYPYGYMGLTAETLLPGQADHKESFCIGPCDPASGMPARQWPEFAGFADAWTAYYAEMDKLSLRLLSIMSLALGLDENWFVARMEHHASALRALRYPKASGAAHEHTDYGLLTLLWAPSPGLQVKVRQGEWLDVPVCSESFVLNAGDMLQRWTNDRWISTPHRVVFTETRRQSIVYFCNPALNALVEALPGSGAAKYPAVRAGDYLMARHAAATNSK